MMIMLLVIIMILTYYHVMLFSSESHENTSIFYSKPKINIYLKKVFFQSWILKQRLLKHILQEYAILVFLLKNVHN